MRFTVALAWFAVAFEMSGIEIRKSPADYPVHGEVADFKVGAEYLVQSFLAEGQSFSTEKYLIVEAGIFPGGEANIPKGEANIDAQRFNLRINGKRLLAAQTPGMVAASLKYPDWTYKPSLEASAGTPDGRGVVLGRRTSVARFPGDNRRPPTPEERNPSPEEPLNRPPDYDHLVKRSALPEGKFNRPVAGFLYFPFDGKLKSIRSVELLIDETALKLR